VRGADARGRRILFPLERTWHSPRAVVGVAIALTVVAALENTVAPWAPFYVVYAVLATALPLVFGSIRLQRPSAPRVLPLVAAFLLALVLQLAFRLVIRGADLPQMFGAVFDAASARLHRPPEVLAVRYVLFIQAWAGLGEELFYRGYVQNQLRHRTGPLPAIAVASFLFAVRHYTQVLITWPAVPWWPATLWVAATLIVGVGIGLLYERTRSLLPPIVCHYVFNLMA
jgi:membrane protease YdiL (CAAX protease family)